MLEDASLGRRYVAYYISPSAQITQLHELGLNEVHVFSESGDQIRDQHGLMNSKDYFLYYLARV